MIIFIKLDLWLFLFLDIFANIFVAYFCFIDLGPFQIDFNTDMTIHVFIFSSEFSKKF